MKKIALLLVLVLLFGCSAMASGQDAESLYQQAMAYINAGDNVSAIGPLTQAAEMGYAEAQSVLGSCYLFGQGVQQSYEEAVKWYGKAAERYSRAREMRKKVAENGIFQEDLGDYCIYGRQIESEI